jgi:hypothetical protein
MKRWMEKKGMYFEEEIYFYPDQQNIALFAGQSIQAPS